MNRTKNEFDQIRQAIARGTKDVAIRMLSQHCPAGGRHHVSLILLETRLSSLQQAKIGGLLSREEESLERNRITEGILELVNSLEAMAKETFEEPESEVETPLERAEPAAPKTVKQRLSTTKPDARKWAIAAAFLLAVAIVWGIGSRLFFSQAAAEPATHDLALHLAVVPVGIPVGNLGKAQIVAGNFTSESVNVPADGALIFKNTPVASDESVKLMLPDLKFKHQIVQKSGDLQSGLFFQIVLKTSRFSGKVLHSNLQPAPGIELEIENGLAKTTTDAAGNFSFELPDWGATTVQLVMRRAGKVLVDKRLGLNAAVFKKLKIPD